MLYQERTIPEVEYSFKHVLMQAAVYQNILQDHRQRIHRQVAEAIEVLYQASLEEHYEQLAHHYDRGGDVEKALGYLFEAGEKAKRRSANEGAIAHFKRGLALLSMLPKTLARTQQELTFLVALGVPLVLTKGHGAAEVETTYTRARALCEEVGDTPQRFQVFLGLRRFYLHRGALQRAYELGEQLLTLGQNLGDPSHVSRAHVMQGETLYRLGAFVQAQKHCAQGLTFYDAIDHRSHIFLYGNDNGVVCYIQEALALWHLGYPDQAFEKGRAGLALAHALAHPFTLAFALKFAATIHQLRREEQIVREQVAELLQISAEQGFSLYMIWGGVLQGWVQAGQGAAAAGIAQMHQGVTTWLETGAVSMLPGALGFLAEAYWKSGQIEAGLTSLAEAFTMVNETGERTFEAELYRLKGELLRTVAEDERQAVVDRGQKDNDLNAEACFLQAIEIARGQEAKMWELRATVSLGRLWQQQGPPRSEAARQKLAEIYNWFTEGFETPDLREARVLLAELAQGEY